MSLVVTLEDPRLDPDVARLLAERDAHMAALYPAESNHLKPIEGLCGPDMRFWTARLDGELVGTGALWLTGADEGEVKSMFVRPARRGRGVSRAILAAVLAEARRLGLARLRLETGHDAEAAKALYRGAGFVERDAFPPYRPDPLSVFMELDLGRADHTAAP